MSYTLSCTEDQIKEVIRKLYYASKPLGMGLGAVRQDIDPLQLDDFYQTLVKEKELTINHIDGRMIKVQFILLCKDQDRHEIKVANKFSSPTVDCQTWCEKYPTWDDLLLECGVPYG